MFNNIKAVHQLYTPGLLINGWPLEVERNELTLQNPGKIFEKQYFIKIIQVHRSFHVDVYIKYMLSTVQPPSL